jgi:aminocarboxymuconate-semialdehyde decarboxylase
MIEILESSDQVVQQGGPNIRFIKEAGLIPGIPIAPRLWDIEQRKRVMSKMGIDFSIISAGNPWINNIPGSVSKDAARKINSEIANIARANRTQFAGLGILPVNSPLDAAEEVTYSTNELQLKGFMVGSRVSKKSIGSEDNIVILEECAKLDVPIYVHPTAPDNVLESYTGNNVISLIYPLETTIAATDIVLGGFFERFPNAKIILSHLGGAVPFLLGRLDRATQTASTLNVEDRKLGSEAHDYFKRFYLDSIAYYTPTLEYVVDLWGAEKIILGSDYPYGWGENRERIIEPIESTKYDESAKSKILAENAVQLFKLDV